MYTNACHRPFPTFVCSQVWLTLVAALALWFALFATICPCGSRLRYRFV